MNAEEYSERKLEIEGWQVNLTTYRIGEIYHCHADNVSPGAIIARTTGSTREEAENKALERAKIYLASTRRHAV